MDANEKTFRHSFGKLALMFLGTLFLGVIAFLGPRDYFLLGLTGIVFVIALFYATSSVKVSDEEITTTRLLGSKSVRWPDIARASTWGQSLRLHNYDGDRVLSLDPQLEGYTEILNIISRKRPDLFDNYESPTLSPGWLGSITTWGTGLIIILMSISMFWGFRLRQAGAESETVFSFFCLLSGLTGLYLIARFFFAPKSLTMEGRYLIVGYFFSKEVSYSVDDINAISLEKQRTRNGYIYFVQIYLKTGKKLRLPTFRQGAPLAYQILTRWRQKASGAA